MQASCIFESDRLPLSQCIFPSIRSESRHREDYNRRVYMGKSWAIFLLFSFLFSSFFLKKKATYLLPIKEYMNTAQSASLFMANIFPRCIEFVFVSKHLPLPTGKETMEVHQSDIAAQRETFESILLCSDRPRKERPPLPGEEERSSHRDLPGYSPIAAIPIFLCDTDT